jgi:hypothetical protein
MILPGFHPEFPVGNYLASLAGAGGMSWQKDRYLNGEKRVNRDMSASPEASEWSGIPAQGSNLLTRLPGRFSFRNEKISFPDRKADLPVAVSPCGEWAFVPITAAGQRGSCTPLPRFHPLKNSAAFLSPRSRDVNGLLPQKHNI